ncbi:triacylglycerol lipase, putative [Talaromyces stipitatus ATCC 10500]|uniref:Carboxylic ester hydrolase n=1 Tax=Talaromyces stipitatus (strain ATCC 10500 / CBS 375.48 / QM 6759 / NRRL 1006) TaxID=441959 RepID=B8MHP2_TALSN|nr:triacylglycerol lipase, putative [Talaromyces stipitatus ATCC 10500]EED16023.1 triacylglycerol lipase, putative [Talaromyces stipitatus ATCC 10500]
MDSQKKPDSLPSSSRDGESHKKGNRSTRAKYYIASITQLLPFVNSKDKPKPSKRRKIIYYAIVAMIFLAIVAIGLGLGLSARAAKDDHRYSNVVLLDYAAYRGHMQDNGVSYWKGMRYAAAPTGSLRFAGPQEPDIVLEVQDAISHGPLCIATGTYPIPSSQSEDCLYVDVYAPTHAKNNTALPVFVWIQGGGYNSLSNANYDATGLIQASDLNIVVVTFNYRVGPYGFLASREVEHSGSLNNGLKDMIKLLQWVQKYIGEFGGDPTHVTIGGDSAGAGAITLLLSAYDGGKQLDGLFHAAVAESQSFGPQLTVSESQFQFDNLTERTGCARHDHPLSCLQNLDIDTLQRHNTFIPYPSGVHPPLYPYGPTIDNNLVSNYTFTLFGEGNFMKIPVIFGDDTNEGTVFTPHNTSSVEQADGFLTDNFPFLNDTELSTINSIYMSQPDNPVYPKAGKYWQGVSNAYGEMRYICPGIYLTTAYNNDSETSDTIWNYHYAVLDDKANTTGYGTQHTVEVNAIWGPEYVSSGSAPKSYSTTNEGIVPLMQGYWTSFIRSYNPNTYRAEGAPEWNTWGNSAERLFIKTNDTHMETAPSEQLNRCRTLQGMAVWNHQ